MKDRAARSAPNLRDHLIYSLALGTGIRLAEIAKSGRAGDIFLPDVLGPKLGKSWSLHIAGEGPPD